MLGHNVPYSSSLKLSANLIWPFWVATGSRGHLGGSYHHEGNKKPWSTLQTWCLVSKKVYIYARLTNKNWAFMGRSRWCIIQNIFVISRVIYNTYNCMLCPMSSSKVGESHNECDCTIWVFKTSSSSLAITKSSFVLFMRTEVCQHGKCIKLNLIWLCNRDRRGVQTAAYSLFSEHHVADSIATFE